MLLKDVFPSDDLDLLEASIRDKLARIAAAGAIGAGVLGGGYGLHKLSNQPPPTSRIEKNIEIPSINEPIEPWVQRPSSEYDEFDIELDTSPQKKPNKISVGGAAHSSFPAALIGQLDADKKQKLVNFKKTFIPVIREVNAEILHDRQNLAKILDSKHKITNSDINLVHTLAERYNVQKLKDQNQEKTIQEIAKDLLLRVDIIPEQLVLAQSALESGWATSELARQANNFFGMKSSSKHEPHEVITHTDGFNYRYYNSLNHSIKSYIHNLNTHKAYRDFRQARAQLKKQKNMTPELLAKELTKHLRAYSASQEYGKKLREIMQTLKTVKI